MGCPIGIRVCLHARTPLVTLTSRNPAKSISYGADRRPIYPLLDGYNPEVAVNRRVKIRNVTP